MHELPQKRPAPMATEGRQLTVYIAGSFKHKHAVRLLGRELRALGYALLDWTEQAVPPAGLTPAQRRLWMDTDKAGGQVYTFCHTACITADLVIYYGASGQDAAVEVGLAAAAGTPVLGLRGPLEAPGLMLHGAALFWLEEAEDLLDLLAAVARHHRQGWQALSQEKEERVRQVSALLAQRHTGQ